MSSVKSPKINFLQNWSFKINNTLKHPGFQFQCSHLLPHHAPSSFLFPVQHIHASAQRRGGTVPSRILSLFCLHLETLSSAFKAPTYHRLLWKPPQNPGRELLPSPAPIWMRGFLRSGVVWLISPTPAHRHLVNIYSVSEWTNRYETPSSPPRFTQGQLQSRKFKSLVQKG